MVFDLSKITGIGPYDTSVETINSGDNAEKISVHKVNSHAFLVERKNTIEVRTDSKLRDLLREKYESVMESRYFGKGGIEIVNSGQLSPEEIADLIRLSYNLTASKTI
ncbi:hypothetical protein IJG79_00290 [Candidatus Saccharibacteria bacterium]|nr:hypothetical protein [Candidatus Saccharibacteria bacterium]